MPDQAVPKDGSVLVMFTGKRGEAEVGKPVKCDGYQAMTGTLKTRDFHHNRLLRPGASVQIDRAGQIVTLTNQHGRITEEVVPKATKKVQVQGKAEAASAPA